MLHQFRVCLLCVYSLLLDWNTVFYEESSLFATEMAHPEASVYRSSSEVPAQPLESSGLSHLLLNLSQLKDPDGATEKTGFICFFVAYQVNDLQPKKYVIRPWYDQRSCYILSCHWQTCLPKWLWQLWSIGFGMSFNISPTPSWSSLLTITGLLLFLTASIKLYIHLAVPNAC